MEHSLSDKSMRELHNIILNLYAEFKRICDKYSLKYFAISGTTIGAVFWNGFIPWDDDMDIAMPAEDYLKFIDLCKTELPNHIKIISYSWFGSKIHNINTTFTGVHYFQYPHKYTGIFIDIVPLINIPDTDNETKIFISDLKNFIHAATTYDLYDIHTGYSEKELVEWQKNILTAYKFGETKKIMDFSNQQHILETKGFKKPIIMNFEKTTIPVSSNYHNDLRIQYGELQKYPPKEKRTHSHFDNSFFSLHKSIEDSAKLYLNLDNSVKEILKKRTKNEGIYYNNLIQSQEYIQALIDENNYLKKQISKMEKKSKTNILHQLINRLKSLNNHH